MIKSFSLWNDVVVETERTLPPGLYEKLKAALHFDGVKTKYHQIKIGEHFYAATLTQLHIDPLPSHSFFRNIEIDVLIPNTLAKLERLHRRYFCDVRDVNQEPIFSRSEHAMREKYPNIFGRILGLDVMVMEMQNLSLMPTASLSGIRIPPDTHLMPVRLCHTQRISDET